MDVVEFLNLFKHMKSATNQNQVPSIIKMEFEIIFLGLISINWIDFFEFILKNILSERIALCKCFFMMQ